MTPTRASTILGRLVRGGAVALAAGAVATGPAHAEVRGASVGPTARAPVALDSGDIVGVEGQFGGAPLRLFAKPRGSTELQTRDLAPFASSAEVIPLAGGRAVVVSEEDGAVRLRTRVPGGDVVEDEVRDATGNVISPGDLQGTAGSRLATSPDGRRMVLELAGPSEPLLLIRGAGETWRAVAPPPEWIGIGVRSVFAMTDSGTVAFVRASDEGISARVLPPGGSWGSPQVLQPLVGFSTASHFLDDLEIDALPDGAVAAAWSGSQAADRHRIAAAELPAGSLAFAPATDVAPALAETSLVLTHDTASEVLLDVGTGPVRSPYEHDLYTGRPGAGLTLERPDTTIVRVEAAGDAILRETTGDLRYLVRSRRGAGGAVELRDPAGFPVDRVLENGTLVSPYFTSVDGYPFTIRVDVSELPRLDGAFPTGSTIGCKLDGRFGADPAGNRVGVLVWRSTGPDAAVFTPRPDGLFRVLDLPFEAASGELVLARTGDVVVWAGPGAETSLLLATGAAGDGRPLGAGVGCPGTVTPMWLRATPTDVGDVRVQAVCRVATGCRGQLAVTLPPLGLPLGARAFQLEPGGQTTVVIRMPAFLRPRILSGGVVPRVTAFSSTWTVLGSTRVTH